MQVSARDAGGGGGCNMDLYLQGHEFVVKFVYELFYENKDD